MKIKIFTSNEFTSFAIPQINLINSFQNTKSDWNRKLGLLARFYLSCNLAGTKETICKTINDKSLLDGDYHE